eukprot:10804868-Ditylum_brightwellii.AAC.1
MEVITNMQKPEDVEEIDNNIKDKPNSKVCSSIPIDTNQHQLMNDMKAAQFWEQVIQKQQDTN